MTEPALRVVVSSDGALACLVEPRQVLVMGLPSLARLAEIGIDAGSDVAVVGERVCVLAKDGTLHVVDPRGADGPEKLGELALEPASRVLATSGAHLLVALGAAGAAGVVGLGDGAPTLWRLPSRAAIAAAGASATEDAFIVCNAGVLEEWSGEARSPLRRFRLERPIAARFVGGGARHVWFVPDAQPDRLVAIPLVGTARPAEITLPERAARAVGDPGGTYVAVVGEQTGAVHLVAVGERAATQVHGGRVGDVAWRGSSTLLCTCDGLMELVELPRAAAVEEEEAAAPEPDSRPLTTRERLAAWKERVARGEQGERDVEPAAELEIAVTAPIRERRASAAHEWRDAIAGWARRQLAGARGELPLLAAGPLHDVGLRLGIAVEDLPFLWLVYGARLCGHDGVAPADLVDTTPRRWDEALGRGKLAATGAFAWRRARVRLVAEIAAALDEVAPRRGAVVASAVVLERVAAVVAPPDADLASLARWAAPQLGSLHVPDERGVGAPSRFVLEARARGLAPLVPWRRASWPKEVVERPAAIVVEDARAADELGVAVALTWPR